MSWPLRRQMIAYIGYSLAWRRVLAKVTFWKARTSSSGISEMICSARSGETFVAMMTRRRHIMVDGQTALILRETASPKSNNQVKPGRVRRR